MATYIHPRPPKTGRQVVEAIKPPTDVPREILTHVKRGSESEAWAKRVLLVNAIENPTYDIDLTTSAEMEHLHVGTLMQPETWPIWSELSGVEWRAEKWKESAWKVRLACAAGWDLSIPVSSRLQAPPVRREEYPGAPRGYETLSMDALQEIGICAWRRGYPSILDVWHVCKTDIRWSMKMMDRIS